MNRRRSLGGKALMASLLSVLALTANAVEPALTVPVTVVKEGINLRIAWISPLSGFFAEESETMNPGSWTKVAAVPVKENDKQHIILPMGDGRKFYRLGAPVGGSNVLVGPGGQSTVINNTPPPANPTNPGGQTGGEPTPDGPGGIPQTPAPGQNPSPNPGPGNPGPGEPGPPNPEPSNPSQPTDPGGPGPTPPPPANPPPPSPGGPGVVLRVAPSVLPDGSTMDFEAVPEVVEIEGFVNYGVPVDISLQGGSRPVILIENGEDWSLFPNCVGFAPAS